MAKQSGNESEIIDGAGIAEWLGALQKFQNVTHVNDFGGSCDVRISAADELSHLALMDILKGMPLEYDIERHVLPLDDPLFVGNRKTTAKLHLEDLEDLSMLVDVTLHEININGKNLIINVTYYRSNGKAIVVDYNPDSNPRFSVKEKSEVADVMRDYMPPQKLAELSDPYAAVSEEVSRQIGGFLSIVNSGLSSMPRYSTIPVIRRQSVMEHTGSVVLISMLLSDYFNSVGVKNDKETVMMKAVLHDVGETVTGDVQYEAKYRMGEASKELKSALEKIENLGLQKMLSGLNDNRLFHRYIDVATKKEGMEIESAIVKLADTIDVILYAKTETTLGNQRVKEIEARGWETVADQLKIILGLWKNDRERDGRATKVNATKKRIRGPAL